MSESAPEQLPVAESASPVLISGLPFAFAQSRNVLLERSGPALTLHYVPPLVTDVRWQRTCPWISICPGWWRSYPTSAI